MDVGARRAWAWSLRKVAISAFLVVHMGATLIWVLPRCPLRERCFATIKYYIMPLGMWQYWGMFAPDPVKETVTLEADVVDARGLRYSYAFPRLSSESVWRAMPRFRHAKFSLNLFPADMDLNRKLTCRHVVRQLALPAEAFPVDVQLLYQVRNAPPPGGPPADPMSPTVPYALGTYHFASRTEVTP